MLESTQLLISSIFLISFLILGTFDGVYFHLMKYKLHLHSESRTEHYIHTTRAFVFAVLSIPIFVINSAGLLLIVAVGGLIIDLVLELFDILVEKNARKNLGGISPWESVLHIFASMFRMASLALLLSLKPLSAWDLSSPLVLSDSYPAYLVFIGIVFSMTSFIGGVGHLLIIPREAARVSTKNMFIKQPAL